jgi:hypothetical protein
VRWMLATSCSRRPGHRYPEETLRCAVAFVGAVTRTEFWSREDRKIGGPRLDSGRGSSSPRMERFVSEDAVRVAGCEMALDVESVLDGGVNG